jgi:hypothetical protein
MLVTGVGFSPQGRRRGRGIMQVRLLGPVDVVVDGGPRPVPGLRRMAVLATLAFGIAGNATGTGVARWVVVPSPPSPDAFHP